MLVLEERGKPEHPEKNLSEQSREPTNSAHIWRRSGNRTRATLVPEASALPLRQPCSPPSLNSLCLTRVALNSPRLINLWPSDSRSNWNLERYQVKKSQSQFKCNDIGHAQDATHCLYPLALFHTSLHNRRYFFAFFRRARASARRARSARHARPLRARLALALARLKNAKNSACSAGYISHNQYTVHMYAQQATVKRGERWKLCRNVPCPGSMIFH